MPMRLEPLNSSSKHKRQRNDQEELPRVNRGNFAMAGNPKKAFGENGSKNDMVAAGSKTEVSIGGEKVHFFDFNMHATKKVVSSALLDVALLMANASQMKSVYSLGHAHAFYTPMMALLSLSLVLQVFIGIALIWLSRININEPNAHKHKVASALATTIVISIFLLTIINIFIATIGITGPKEESKSEKESGKRSNGNGTE